MTDWIPTRAEGERRLSDFTPRIGRRYANGRNTDHGPGAQKLNEEDCGFEDVALAALDIRTAGALSADDPASLARWAESAGASQIAPTGFFKVKQAIPRLLEQVLPA